MLARNLLGICPEFARNLLGTRSSLAICSEFACKTARTSHARNSPFRPFGGRNLKNQGKNLFLVNHAFAWETPAIFVIFVVFVWGSKEKSFLLEREECNFFCHSRNFRPNALFLVGGESTARQKHVCQKHGFVRHQKSQKKSGPVSRQKFLECHLTQNL